MYKRQTVTFGFFCCGPVFESAPVLPEGFDGASALLRVPPARPATIPPVTKSPTTVPITASESDAADDPAGLAGFVGRGVDVGAGLGTSFVVVVIVVVEVVVVSSLIGVLGAGVAADADDGSADADDGSADDVTVADDDVVAEELSVGVSSLVVVSVLLGAVVVVVSEDDAAAEGAADTLSLIHI